MAKWLSVAARDVLIDHMDGNRVRYFIGSKLTGAARRLMSDKQITQTALAKQGYLEFIDQHYTVITDIGREKLAGQLANYAEALVRAGYGSPVHDRSERISYEEPLWVI